METIFRLGRRNEMKLTPSTLDFCNSMQFCAICWLTAWKELKIQTINVSYLIQLTFYTTSLWCESHPYILLFHVCMYLFDTCLWHFSNNSVPLVAPNEVHYEDSEYVYSSMLKTVLFQFEMHNKLNWQICPWCSCWSNEICVLLESQRNDNTCSQKYNPDKEI